MSWWQHFRDRLASLRSGPALDALLTHARPDQSLAERVAWVEDLLAWVRRDGPATRMRLLMQMLERQPEARARVGQTLRSIVRDTQALDLFADTGLPRGVAFMHELMSRLMSRVLPDPPDTRDLADIFDRLFPHVRVADWLEQLDAEFAGWIVGSRIESSIRSSLLGMIAFAGAAWLTFVPFSVIQGTWQRVQDGGATDPTAVVAAMVGLLAYAFVSSSYIVPLLVPFGAVWMVAFRLLRRAVAK